MAYSLAWQDTVVIAGSSPIVEWELQVATFRVVANDIVWDERTVRYDYSFEDSDWGGEDRTLSEPVNGHADSRMRIMTSYWRETAGTIEIVSQ